MVGFLDILFNPFSIFSFFAPQPTTGGIFMWIVIAVLVIIIVILILYLLLRKRRK